MRYELISQTKRRPRGTWWSRDWYCLTLGFVLVVFFLSVFVVTITPSPVARWMYSSSEELPVMDVVHVPHLNDRPIVGVLTVPLEQGGCVTRMSENKLRGAEASHTSCFHSPYVKWLEAGGARVVPIPFDAPRERLKYLALSVNGVLFTGGDVPLRDVSSEYMNAARFLLELVVEQNEKGVYTPLWATCMGFQVLSVLVGGPQVLEHDFFKGVDPKMLPLEMTSEARTSSKMFGREALPELLWKALSERNVTTNLHHDGVSPESFESIDSLNTFFRVLSTNHDENGKPFVSTIEARRYPIYGVQWHPERPQYHFFPEVSDQINHHLDAVLCSTWTSIFFVETRFNLNKFASPQEEQENLIYNFQPIGTTSKQVYLF